MESCQGRPRHQVRKGAGTAREGEMRDKDRALRRQGARPFAPVQGLVRVRHGIQGVAMAGYGPDAIQVSFQPAGSAEGLAVAGVRKVQAPPGNGVIPASDLECACGASKTVWFKKDNHKVSRRERHPCQGNWDARRPMPPHDGRTVPAWLGSKHFEGPRDGKSPMADLRLANGGVAGIDSFRCGDRARATLMDDEGAFACRSPEGFELGVRD